MSRAIDRVSARYAGLDALSLEATFEIYRGEVPEAPCLDDVFIPPEEAHAAPQGEAYTPGAESITLCTGGCHICGLRGSIDASKARQQRLCFSCHLEAYQQTPAIADPDKEVRDSIALSTASMSGAKPVRCSAFRRRHRVRQRE